MEPSTPLSTRPDAAAPAPASSEAPAPVDEPRPVDGGCRPDEVVEAGPARPNDRPAPVDGPAAVAADRWWRPSSDLVLLAAAIAALMAGGALHLRGAEEAAAAVWGAATAAGVVASAWWVVGSLRARRIGVDVIAVLALVGALAVREVLAGAVITVMLTTGRALEARAGARARRELQSLLERAPRSVHRYAADGVEVVPVEAVVVGDLLLVAPGEVVPVDGWVERGVAVLDEAALTGEPLPVERATGDPVRSGTVNAGAAFDLRATTTAGESTYAGILRLVAEAEASSAPFVRLADRFSVVFLAVTAVVAGGAWLLSGDPVRAVAVLVVATPCPLILAAPVAIVSGISQAAKRGVVVKGGAALERLATGEVLLFDKTGTLTEGRPTLSDVVASGSMVPAEVLRLAASLDQLSPHVLAGAIVRAAHAQGLDLELPTDVQEVPGHGVTGRVAGREVTVGKGSWLLPDVLPRWARRARRRADLDGALTMFVRVEGEVVGAIVLEDPIRADAARTIRNLRRNGFERIVMVTGDRADVAETVGAVIGVDAVLAERTPAEKVEAVRAEGRARPTIMVGDGINDAPALALADVGVAVGARGSTASSESADVVLTVDRLDRLSDAMVIARRARRIARQSVIAGIGLSFGAMGVAAVGFLAPAWGALLQEAIDVAVIVNALRVLRVHGISPTVNEEERALVQQFTGEHRTLRPDLGRLREAADQLGAAPSRDALAAVRSVHTFLEDELLPHEMAEDAVLYPVFARVLGGHDPTGTMSRAHVEIAHLVRRLGRLLDAIDPEEPDPDDLNELRRVLYGLHAILQLHFSQEDEGYLSLVDDATRERPTR